VEMVSKRDAGKNIKKELKNILEEINVDYTEIISFGSRVRKTADEWSDWDFLIVLKSKLSPLKKRKLWYTIYRKFHEKFPLISIDIILKDEETFRKERNIVNTLSYEAHVEGISI
jgi:predicted nucleotidyltransferase